MGNSAKATVKRKGAVDLEFTSGKVLALNDVYFISQVRKNLVSGGLLNKFGFKQVFESDKYVLTKDGVFVVKWYMCDGMFKLNIDMNKSGNSAYIIDSFHYGIIDQDMYILNACLM